MIGNALELSRFLCQQAQNSGFAQAGIVIVLDNNGVLHKSEFGLVMSSQAEKENVIEMTPVEAEVAEADAEE